MYQLLITRIKPKRQWLAERQRASKARRRWEGTTSAPVLARSSISCRKAYPIAENRVGTKFFFRKQPVIVTAFPMLYHVSEEPDIQRFDPRS
jgi:hypothetical protein